MNKYKSLKVDISWKNKEKGILKARLYKGKKRKSGYRFLIQTITKNGYADCDICPFYRKTICRAGHSHLCSELWDLPGDNKFEGRKEVRVFSPIPLDYDIR